MISRSLKKITFTYRRNLSPIEVEVVETANARKGQTTPLTPLRVPSISFRRMSPSWFKKVSLLRNIQVPLKIIIATREEINLPRQAPLNRLEDSSQQSKTGFKESQNFREALMNAEIQNMPGMHDGFHDLIPPSAEKQQQMTFIDHLRSIDNNW
jgi:hypothetical protein